jgi:hypothetical protein
MLVVGEQIKGDPLSGETFRSLLAAILVVLDYGIDGCEEGHLGKRLCPVIEAVENLLELI